MHVKHEHEAGHGHHGIMLAIVGALGGVGDIVGPGGGVVDADAGFLAFHVAVDRADADFRHARVGAGFKIPGDQKRADEHDKHDQPDVPSMRAVVDHPAVVIGQSGDDGEKEHELQEFRQAGRIFKGMGAVGARDAGAVKSQHLGRGKRGHWSLYDPLHGGLRGADRRFRLIDDGGLGVRAEIHRYALPDIQRGKDQADRQEQIQRDTREIHPEISDVRRLFAGDAAHQHRGHGDAHGGGEEEVQCGGDDLREMGEHLLRFITLPVGIGGETGTLQEGNDSWNLAATDDVTILVKDGSTNDAVLVH